ncbi:hypothetical protein IMSAG185_01988 [Lachnospiraceae bacterium]|jgi:hypothetical protein|nr:hypothetical protein IMSAG185_01988 [Lachnospiraceae bacterium]
MTAEEIFCDLFDKYGEDFNWYMIPLSQSNGTFVEELKREIGEGHFLYHREVWAVAKCASNDDVLYAAAGESGTDIYYIFHLTYSKQNSNGFPKYEKFIDIYAVKEFIEKTFIQTCLR